MKPLTVEVVALDWKWLFIYPEQGIAVVNDLAAPVDVPINFKITASSVMNSFYHPGARRADLCHAGHANRAARGDQHAGDYDGFSANYSGAGFSDMRFKFHGLSGGGFRALGADGARRVVRRSIGEGYLQLEQPSEHDPVRRYCDRRDRACTTRSSLAPCGSGSAPGTDR